MNVINKGTNIQSYWNEKHKREYDLDKPYDNNAILNSKNSYHFVAGEIIRENKDEIKIKKILEIGCAGGNFLFYVKTLIAPEFECIGEDFSHSAIEAANNRAGLDCVNFQCVDILENPIQKDYGIICVFEVLEHIEEGQNFKILDNMLDHCEYLIISVPTTKDSCFGEHISHYNWDTFEKNNYNVLWKARLDKIDMSNIGDNGDYFHFITLIHGKL